MRIIITYDETPLTLYTYSQTEDIIAYKKMIANVKNSLTQKGHTVEMLGINFPLYEPIKKIELFMPDVIFNLCEGIMGISSTEYYITAIYELLNIPYTGADSLTLERCLSKRYTKEVLRLYGINTPHYFTIENLPFLDQISENGLAFPLIVKPATEDASIGIDKDSVVYNIEDLKKKVEHVFKTLAPPVLVEQYIEGREFNVAIVSNPPFALPISEIDFSTLPSEYPAIVTYKGKWDEDSIEYKGTKPICPARLDKNIKNKIEEMSLKAFKIMECRDYARVDLRMDNENNLYILEVNPNPDISPDAGLARAARTYGWDYSELLNAIVQSAFNRTIKQKNDFQKINN